MVKRSLPLVLCAALLFMLPPAAAQCPHGSLAGNVTYVRDGDTIELGSMAIRFWGIAAPEWDAPGGQEATDAIKDMVLGKQVRCELTGKKTYDRCVGVCYLNGINIEEELVRIGLAPDCPRFSGGRYREVEQAAADQGATIRETYRLPGYCRAR